MKVGIHVVFHWQENIFLFKKNTLFLFVRKFQVDISIFKIVYRYISISLESMTALPKWNRKVHILNKRQVGEGIGSSADMLW